MTVRTAVLLELELPREQYGQLMTIAEAQHRSVDEVVQRAVAEWLETQAQLGEDELGVDDNEDEEPDPPLRIIRLGGLLKGYEFTPEEIAEARREMWKGLENFEL